MTQSRVDLIITWSGSVNTLDDSVVTPSPLSHGGKMDFESTTTQVRSMQELICKDRLLTPNEQKRWKIVLTQVQLNGVLSL